MRVPRNTHAPLRLPGMLPLLGHCAGQKSLRLAELDGERVLTAGKRFSPVAPVRVPAWLLTTSRLSRSCRLDGRLIVQAIRRRLRPLGPPRVRRRRQARISGDPRRGGSLFRPNRLQSGARLFAGRAELRRPRVCCPANLQIFAFSLSDFSLTKFGEPRTLFRSQIRPAFFAYAYRCRRFIP